MAGIIGVKSWSCSTNRHPAFEVPYAGRWPRDLSLSLTGRNNLSSHKAHRPMKSISVWKKKQAGRQRWDELFRLLSPERARTAGAWRSLCVRRLFVTGKDACFQAVIRQPWGSVKTLFPFHLNCCTHPANWNLATGSQPLSLKCCQVIETRECGIMVASDAWLSPPSPLSLMPQFQSHHRHWFSPFFIHISCCTLCLCHSSAWDSKSKSKTM